MSLTAAMNIGRSALATSQLGLQVAGNNMANAATPGYSRQVGRLVALRGDTSVRGLMIGAGVGMRGVQRQVDEAVEARLRLSTADHAYAAMQSQVYAGVEDALGELGDNDLSSQLSAFFTAWSERANAPASGAAVIQKGEQLAAFVRRLRDDLGDQKRQINAQVGAAVARADQLLTEIAALNGEIAQAEAGGATANTLRDQRDASVRELSGMMDVTVVDRGREGADVLVGSVPVVLGAQSRGLRLRSQAVGDEIVVSVATAADGSELSVASGQLGALLQNRGQAVEATIQRLDTLTSQLIFQVNRLHSTGTPPDGLRAASATLGLSAAERAMALNDAQNATLRGLPFQAVNGGFTVRYRSENTGVEDTVRINIDLDGLTASGTPGTADDTTAEDIRAALAAVPGLTAAFTADGRLEIAAAEGVAFSFEDDSSGVLAVLGVNSYFTGVDGSDIAVRGDLAADPGRLAAGRYTNGAYSENGTVLALAGLQSEGIAAIGGKNIPELWRDGVLRVGAEAATALSAADAAAVVRDSLEAQRAAVSGVSIDEESLNLLEFQRQYQGAAKLIAVAQEMTQVLLQLI